MLDTCWFIVSLSYHGRSTDALTCWRFQKCPSVCGAWKCWRLDATEQQQLQLVYPVRFRAFRVPEHPLVGYPPWWVPPWWMNESMYRMIFCFGNAIYRRCWQRLWTQNWLQFEWNRNRWEIIIKSITNDNGNRKSAKSHVFMSFSIILISTTIIHQVLIICLY